MAPLNPNNTERYKVFYTNSGHQHTTQVRTDSVSPSSFGAEFDLLMQSISGDLTATVIDEVQFAASGSDIFNAVASGIEGNTYGSGAGDDRTASQYADFVGRSTGGRRVRLAIFGLVNTSLDNRFVAGESAAFDAAVALLNATTPQYLAIDGIKGVWKTYTNTGFNAHWQRAVRP